MKSLKICKSTLSMILAIVMLISMCTVAFLNTAAAETDVAQTGAGTTVYFQNNWKWTDVRIHVWDSNQTALAGSWPGATMTKVGTYGDYDYYKYTLPSNAIGFIFNGIKNDGSGQRDQSPDMTTIPTNDHFYYMNYSNGNQCLQANESITVKFPSEGGGSTDPSEDPSEDPVDPANKITISFLINSDTKWVASDDAKMFIKAGSTVTQMDETVDTKSGHVMWTAEVEALASYTFYRTSYFFDESNASTKAWNSWTASGRGTTNTVFKATSGSAGSWQAASTVNAADPKDIENFWDDLWIAPVDKNDVDHAVKVYYDGSEFNLFVPSYYNLSNVVVYSDHESVVIGSTTIASGSTASLTTGLDKTFQFKDGSTTTNKGKINIYQTTGTAAMMMTTKEELWTGTTAGLADANAWPSGSGITSTNFNGVYKDAIETKGSYYFYSEEGELVNSDTVLKKIKGRGNSTFEASMRIYGKYAYNFNLDKKAELIAGATEAKKWSILANNGDITMLRNTLVYSIADDLGIKYAPETRLVDLYDNGKYLGSYILTEKVEYGKNTLMSDMKNLDDGNEDANIEYYQNEDIMDTLEDYLVQAETSVTVNGQKYTYQYTKSSDETNYPYKQPADYNTYNYLLEFELFNRYQSEASWFVSPRTGQAVVVKYPEFATQDEMEWIISQYEAAESAIYSDNYNDIAAAVDVDSFVKMYLLQELALNLDSCATSYYIHNDLNSGKLVSSPVWDYDWGFGAYANGTDSGKKYVYNGSSVSVNSTTLDNPKQMFVKNKALKTDSGDNTKESNYNFQAKLVHNETVWERCQYIWTNEMIDILPDYIDNDDIDGITGQRDDGVTEGLLLDTWLDSFSSSLEMNDARWGSVNFTGDNWGTKITTNYTPRSFNFYVGDTTKAGNASKKYSNAVHYLNDWVVERWNHMSSENGGALYNEELVVSYEVTGASFIATQEEDVVTIRPSATVTLDGVDVPAADISYTVYVDGNAQGTYDFTQNATVTIEDGKKSEIYIVVFPTADPSVSDESGVQEFEYGYIAPDMNFTVMFKSSDSIRYLPYVTVNGTKYPMTKTGEPIKKNATGMQTYSWYEATVTIKEDEAAAIIFTNAYSMRGSITLAEVTADATYYFGVDNLNNGTTAVDLTNSSETVKNFVKSASYMVDNNPEAAGVATTSLDGTMYILGDTDGSNSISILDATALQRALAKKTDLSETGSALADYNLDETKSIMDVTMMQVYLANNG